MRAESPLVSGHRYDGRLSDSTFGIYRSLANNVPNADFETNKLYWSNDVGSNVSQALDDGNIGSGRLVWGTTAASGLWFGTTTTGSGRISSTPGQPYTWSVWLKGAAGGEQVKLNVEWYTGANALISTSSSSTVTLTTSWALYEFTATAPGTGVGCTPTITNVTTTMSAKVDGASFVNCPYGLPTVHTDGATASGGAPRVQIAVNATTPTAFWFAFRLRYGWAATAIERDANLLTFADSATSKVVGWFQQSTKKWAITRQSAGGTMQAVSAVATHVKGDKGTIIVRGEATRVGVSVNGGAFVNDTTGPFVPTLSATTIDLATGGTLTANRELDSDVLWMLSGVGTLSDADAATIHAIGDTDPVSLSGIPGTPTTLWNANTSAYTYSAPSTAPQVARPASDISAGGWGAFGGGSLYVQIDETPASDVDYDQSSASPTSADIMEVKYSSLTDPGTSNDGSLHHVRYRIGKSATGGDRIDITVRLVQGTTVIASWTHTAVDALTSYDQTLTDAQANAITDYTNLRLRVEAVKV